MQVEELAEEQKLDNGELFILTANKVFKGCFHKGNSNSHKVNELVMRLLLVYMETCCILHVIYVAGTHMKKSGIYGLYQRNLLEGMINGQNPLDFITLNESADERLGGRVVIWIKYWWKDRTGASWRGRALKRLSPDYWFEIHTQDRPRLWTPPPEEMETVVGLFNEDRL